MPKQNFRDNGAIGALLDEYEKSIKELQTVISDIAPADLIQIVDNVTEDEDCRSIQTILAHVLSSGYTYVIEIRKWLGETLDYKEKVLKPSVSEYIIALDEMFLYNLNLFKDFPNIKIEEHANENKIKVRWGQSYDVEQLFEHAIVHILRHRRQIERFKIKLGY